MIIKLYFSFKMLAQISQPGTWLIHEVPADRFQDLMSITDSCVLQHWKIFKNIFEYYHYNSWYIHLHIKGKKGASSLVSFMWCLKLKTKQKKHVKSIPIRHRVCLLFMTYHTVYNTESKCTMYDIYCSD